MTTTKYGIRITKLQGKMNKEDGILMSKFLRGEVKPRKPLLTWKIRTWVIQFSRKVIKIHG